MFRPVGEKASFTSLDLHPSNALTHRFVLQGLDKFTSYQVVVQAYNKQGLGPASTAAVATTTEDGKSYYSSRTTDAQRGNSRHYWAENSIAIPNF